MTADVPFCGQAMAKQMGVITHVKFLFLSFFKFWATYLRYRKFDFRRV